MKFDMVQAMPLHGVAYDTETYVGGPGLKIPPLVCASAGWLGDDGQVEGELLDKEQAQYIFAQLLDDRRKVIVGANIPYDLAVLAVHCAKQGVDLMPAIFRALNDDQRVYDLLTAEALHALAEGHLFDDPRTGGPLKDPETGKQSRYSLASVVDLVLGRKNAKANDEYRLRYGELDTIPIHLWPPQARDYPVDDAKNTIEVALAQIGYLKKYKAGHSSDSGQQKCRDCGLPLFGGAPCLIKQRHRNLHDLGNQVGAKFALHMGASWGLRVNQASVDIIERERKRGREGTDKPFIDLGILRKDGSQDLSRTKKLVALAYGASEPCPVCKGTGKVPSPKAKVIRCRTCRGHSAAAKATPAVMQWKLANPKGCPDCNNQGQYLDPTALIICYSGTEIDPTDGKERKIKTCDGTGLLLTEDVPRSDKDGIGYGRDVLNESGNEDLIGFAAWDEDKKDLDVYVPFFRRARMPIAGHGPDCKHIETKQKTECICPGPYKDIPLTLWPNELVETGRVSYDGIIQLIKRAQGYINELGEYIPSLRECFEARVGYVYSSTDYEAGELVTHAQNCIWTVGYSDLADALNAGKKPHNMLGASMIGMLYEEYEKRAKEPQCKDARQAAKAANFGFPGGAGAPTLVLQKRKEAIDTPCPNGPHWIEDDNGNKVRGYRGLRFCILMDKAERCGERMTNVWGDRKIKPSCVRCIECALRLKEFWFDQWSENKHYFRWVTDVVDNGQLITAEMLDRWPHLKPWFTAGERLAPGEIMQHVSGRIRGGVTFTSAANGFFQGLLADACKSALRRAARECYDKTYVVPSMAHENSTPSKYAGGRSPLYGSRPIVFAHDEIIFEHPEAMGHDAAMRVSEIMVEELRWYCPDVAAACRAEPTLMRKWFKQATKVVHNGRLVPWTPEHNEKTCEECKAEKTKAAA